MKSELALLCVVTLVSCNPCWGGSSEIPGRLNKLTNELADGYRRKNVSATKKSIAIFALNSSEKLEKERVGFAISELLTYQFVKDQTFTVVERAEFNKIMSEQKLGLTGAIDPGSAVRIGKLLGARILLLGSVEKLGGKYQVNARLVGAENGEVLSTAYQEFDVDNFENEARPYLALVPERQTIGFYFLYNYRYNSNSVPSQSFPARNNSGTVTLIPKPFSLQMVGAGIRYFPISELMVDFSGSASGNTPVVAPFTFTPGFSAPLQGNETLLGGYSLRGTLSWVHPWTRSARTYLGSGIVTYSFPGDENGFSGMSAYHAIAWTLRAGYEYKIQERLGLGAFFNYDFINGDGTGTNLVLNERIFRLERWSIEPAIALYF